MKSVFRIRKRGVFNKEPDSFADLTITVKLVHDAENLCSCPVCQKYDHGFTPFVESADVGKIDLTGRDFTSPEKIQILSEVGVWIQQMLRRLTPCMLTKGADKEHYDYLKSLFTLRNCVLQSLNFY